MAKISEKILSTVRARIASGDTPYAISKATGIDQAVLSRWLGGQRGISVDTQDTLAEYLGLVITIKTKGTRAKGDASK